MSFVQILGIQVKAQVQCEPETEIGLCWKEDVFISTTTEKNREEWENGLLERDEIGMSYNRQKNSSEVWHCFISE